MLNMELEKSNILSAYEHLSAIAKQHRFDNRMLNVGVLKNKARLEPIAKTLAEKRATIFDKHAAKWKQGDEVPDNAEPGQMKTKKYRGKRVPRWKNEDHAELAAEKINNLFEGTKEVDVHTVPLEAMDIPEGETIDFWDPVEFMFEDA